jgi:hypothetical protein
MHFFHIAVECFSPTLFAMSKTATTVRDGGNLQGSARPINKTRQHCQMTDKKFCVFAHHVLGLNSINKDMGTEPKRHTQNDQSFLNMLLSNFTFITKCNLMIHIEIKEYQQALACAPACCLLLLLGTDVPTLSIVQRVCGATDLMAILLSSNDPDIPIQRAP